MSISHGGESFPSFSAALNPWGWNPFFATAYASLSAESAFPDRYPARIVAEHQGLYRWVGGPGEGLAELSGSLRYHSLRREDLPAVGDWVRLHWQPQMQHARIEALLPRRSAFVRKQAGTRAAHQVVAANLDTVLLVTALNQDLNLRRLERYLTLAWDSGARPVIVLSKADLSEQPEALLQGVQAVALGADICVLSALTGEGLGQLQPWLGAGQTLALLGSSGVGKSTLVNALLGEARQDTGSVRRDDDKGRHTTTHRELFRLPSGALVIDTPGMRELQLVGSGEGLETSFADLEALVTSCRYRNCQHAQEPGCAVQAALASGELERGRWHNYSKLLREEAYQSRREDPLEQAAQRRLWKKRSLNAQANMRQKYTGQV
ncbi:MAG: ribosome small subunit-dependent GTPase A [Candidatus Sericytochromatia bacterium]